jgi:hypothetical protein
MPTFTFGADTEGSTPPWPIETDTEEEDEGQQPPTSARSDADFFQDALNQLAQTLGDDERPTSDPLGVSSPRRALLVGWNS